jgi:MFS family permease
VGKAVRSPSRDAILSHATKEIGRGWGFGLHEALDQVGAVIGPLILTAALLWKGDYRSGFGMLWIPAVLAMIALAVAKKREPSPASLETSAETTTTRPRNNDLGGAFWRYALFTFLSVAGLAGFPLISYHLVAQNVVPQSQIALLYAAAMGGVDAGAALLAGKLYDRTGLASLAVRPVPHPE